MIGYMGVDYNSPGEGEVQKGFMAPPAGPKSKSDVPYFDVRDALNELLNRLRLEEISNTLSLSIKKPGIYLSGPMAECDDDEMKIWREEATRALEGNFTIKDPCARDFRGFPMTEKIRNEIVEGDLKDIDESAVVLINYFRPKALPPMIGTSMEVMYSYMNNKMNVLIDNGLDKVSPWLRYHVDETFQTLEESCAFLNLLAQVGYFDVKPVDYRKEIEAEGFPKDFSMDLFKGLVH